MLSPPCEAFKGEMKRGAFPLTPCRKGRAASPLEKGTNVEIPGIAERCTESSQRIHPPGPIYSQLPASR
jgi:hypothetical protein